MDETTPTRREMDALRILWRLRRASVYEIQAELLPVAGKLAYTTVLSVMQSLEKKGLVGHEQAGKAYVYFPKEERAVACRGWAVRLFERVFDGALDEYVAPIIESNASSLEQLERVEKMIAEAKARVKQRKRRDRK